MGLTSRLVDRLIGFLREMDHGLAVMRGEEPIAGHKPGIDWSKHSAVGHGRRCRRRCAGK